MVFKAVFLCAFTVMVQQCVAKSCYRPIKTSCGCGSGKINVSEVEEIGEISYRPSVSAVSIKSGYSGGRSSGCVSIDVPNYGGSLGVTSICGIAPSGIAIATDLGLTGDLVLSGELPYLTAVAFEGEFATNGEVPVSYGCGDGCIAITEQIGGINAGAGAYSGAGAYGISSIQGCGCKC